MPIITTLSRTRSFVLLVFAFLGFQSYLYAQCAGDDNAVEFCSKQDQQFIDLFTQLNGTPATGGTWSDDDDSGGLDNADATNGMLNTYAITKGGVFHYTYTISGDDSCTDNSATITLTLGSYAGVDNNGAVACGDDSSVNLFQFTGSSPSPTGDGSWTSPDSPNGYAGGSRFDASKAGKGVYTFIYTVPAQGDNCPSQSSTVQLEVVPSPQSGTAEKQVFCETQDFSGLRNYNLRSVLQNEDDDGAWSESSKTNEISRPGDPFINLENLRDLGPGLYDFTYTVNPINPTCIAASTTVTIEIEEVIDFSSAVFSITDPSGNICISDLPYNTMGKIVVDANAVPDDEYQLTYSVSPTPNAGSETIPVSFKGGVATFAVNPDFITDIGDVNIEVTQIIDPNTQNNCQASINGLVANFKVTAPPDLSDTQVVINDPVCLGESTTATLSDKGNKTGIQLADGLYGLEYSISGSDETPSADVTINVVNGTAVFGLQLDDQGTAGEYTFYLKSVRSSGTCITSANIEDTFTISPKADATLLTIEATDACGQENITVSLADGTTPLSFENGTYSLKYALTGNNDIQASLDNVVFTDGKASFSIDATTLIQGKTNITITSIQNQASSCEAINLADLTTSFTLSQNPDLTDATFSVDPVCEGQSATVALTAAPANVPDANYTISYSVADGTNTAEYTATAEVTTGTASFEIAPEAITAATTYALTINGFSNNTTGCEASGLPLTANFQVFANPQLDTATLTAATVCSADDVAVAITGAALTNGDYELVYAITGANTIKDSISNLSFVDGKASFTILSNKLGKTGKNTLALLNIKTVQTGCETILSGIETNFNINTTPNVTTAELSYDADLCLGATAIVIIKDDENNLEDGNYTLIYSLDGANIISNQPAVLEIVSGEGSFTIPADQLVNSGSTLFTINNIAHTDTSCSLDSPGLTGTFIINAQPDLSEASILVDDSCEGTMDRTITVQAPNLDDGTYNFTYTVSGANAGTATADNISIQNGSGTMIIDGTLLKNTGDTDVNLNAVSSAATSCISDELNVATTFTINPKPQLDNDNLSVSSVCFGESHIVSINEPALGNATYMLTYTLSDANVKEEQTINISTVNGKASFNLDAADLTASGNTTLTIERITNSSTLCTSTGTNTASFEVYPIPSLADSTVAAVDVCLNEDGMVTVTGGSGLTDMEYSVTYSLSGATTAIAQEAQLLITDGKGSFNIPTALLSAAGMVTVNIENITSAVGCTSGAILVSSSFEILPLPDAAGISVAISDYCINNDVPVNISGAVNLADGDYRIDYSLNGANIGNNTINVAFTGGNASFTLPAAELSERGNTTLSITNVKNFIDLCGAENINGASATFEVQDPDPPTLAASGNVFCINDEPKISDLLARITPTSGLHIYESETDNIALNENNTLINGKSYFISITSSESGCESSVRLEVTVDLTGCGNIFIPEGFSPNGDGVNDTFTIQNIGFVYPSYTLEIFNRLGNVVYKGGANMPAWDGHSNQHTISDKVLPNGVYFYIINYNDGQTSPKQGKLYLNR